MTAPSRFPLRKTPASSARGSATVELLAGAIRRSTRFVFPSMAGVFHCGDCADGPRPVGIVALPGESSITVAGLPEPGCTLHLLAVARLFLLATLIGFPTKFIAARRKDMELDSTATTTKQLSRWVSIGILLSGNRPGPRRPVPRQSLSANRRCRSIRQLYRDRSASRGSDCPAERTRQPVRQEGRTAIRN